MSPQEVINCNPIKEFKKTFKETRNSVLFWNGVVYLIFIISASFSFKLASMLSDIGSMIFIIIYVWYVILNDEDKREGFYKHMWFR